MSCLSANEFFESFTFGVSKPRNDVVVASDVVVEEPVYLYLDNQMNVD